MTCSTSVSGRARDRASATRGPAARALQDAVQHLMVVVEAFVPACVTRDEARLMLVRPGLLTLPAAHEPHGVRGVQLVHPVPRLALQVTRCGDHALQLVGETRKPGVAGSHMGGFQRHDSVAEKPSSILEIGHVMQLDACYASD